MGWKEIEAKKLEGNRVLVVGAGGIGCELLKNLALTGYQDIHVIDMDTIDVSNLNRQFLFRREHVGRSKAEVASEAIRQMRPDIKITYDLDSILSSKFNLPFFQQFSLVLNALDNRAARNHVNRMCLAAKIPLIESGSAGYLGQVRPILRDRTECYECLPKPAQDKTFPGCTIRNTPSEHIHCTVWSKHAFNQLFGELDIDDDISPDITDKDARIEGNSPEGDSGAAEEHTKVSDGMNGVDLSNGSNGNSMDSASTPISTRAWAENVNYDPEKIFDKLFYDDINYLLLMQNLWRERRPPTPLRRAEATAASASSSTSGTTDDANKIWSLAECADVFCECVATLSRRKIASEEKILHWDKDDDVAMRFVAACANIRATIFGIPCKSLFEIKSMAGNIIPAIATTNAIVAGMMVVEAGKILSGEFDKLRVVFISLKPNPRGKILVDQVPFEPNPNCFVCSEKRECHVRLNPAQMTVKSLQDKVLKGALNMVAPDVMEATTSRIILSSEEGETTDLEPKTLDELSIGNGAMLTCDDFLQRLELRVIITESKTMKGDEFEIVLDSGEVKPDVDESRKRKSTAPPDELDEQNAAKRPKL
uniref:SUMO-activating enzyme subunit n=1 Tax=Haemonchus contortus TaxID=6289 RepID=A0A7I4Y310_HAECO|nr:UBA THIF-type NAD FAD binding fold and Ubiquitin-activating enzyme repeat domain containing protein [Haemonchus contortus]